MTNNVARGFDFEIKKVEPEKRDDAVGLIFAVFMEFEAPNYSSEGVETFKKTAVYNEDFLDTLEMYGAYTGDRLIGVIATRNSGNHIALFFVDGNYHRLGVGKKLFQVVVENSTAKEITVNSSPYAVEVYHRLGFVDTNHEQNVQGIKFTPMKFTKFNEG